MHVVQVLALLLCPELMDDPGFPQDAKDRAQRVLNDTLGHTISKFPNCSIHFVMLKWFKSECPNTGYYWCHPSRHLFFSL